MLSWRNNLVWKQLSNNWYNGYKGTEDKSIHLLAVTDIFAFVPETSERHTHSDRYTGKSLVIDHKLLKSYRLDYELVNRKIVPTILIFLVLNCSQ